jgi:sec-independent protein translocase protein TatA
MKLFSTLFILVAISAVASAFLPHVPMQGQGRAVIPSSISGTGQHLKQRIESARRIPIPVQRQRRSVGVVQTMGLFGLGLPEIAIIAVAVAFVVGPEKLGAIVRSSGETASKYTDELKNVPTEFQKGLQEGEQNVKSRKAKPMDRVPSDEDESEEQ